LRGEHDTKNASKHRGVLGDRGEVGNGGDRAVEGLAKFEGERRLNRPGFVW
jgi:hypothetical protein